MKTYRKGPIGALADEYEKVLNELKTLLITISNEKFTRIVDDSVPKKFQSIRTIVLHLVNSGYVYANHIRKRFGNETKAKAIDINTTEEAIMHLDTMFQYTLATFEDKWQLTYDDLMNTIIKTSWTTYDMEALIEHAKFMF